MKNKKEMIGVLGDFHIESKREKSINFAIKEILKKIKNKKFNKLILLGDLTSKTPTVKERVILANFLKQLQKQTKEIVIIRGTSSHDFVGDLYNFEDITILTDIKAVDEYEVGDYLFTHGDFQGLTYTNGKQCESKRKVPKDKKIINGHWHSSQTSTDLVTNLGSIYKVSFSEINDQKRIAIITGEEIEFIDIKSFPMYQINLIGKNGKVKVKGLKEITEKEIDLKIVAETDNQTIGELNRVMNKIKNKFDIEYFVEDLKILNIKTDVPKNLNQKELLKLYCQQNKVNYTLIETELKK